MAVENGKQAAEAGGGAAKPERAVKITEKSSVQPRKPTANPKVALATFDLPYITFYYNQKLLVYKQGAEEFAVVVGKMKEALAEVLEEFYPLAGKLVQEEEDRALYVECEGTEGGVEVVEAEAEEVVVADLAEGEAPEELMKELVPYTGVMNLEGFSRPLVAVQLTKLKDGIALGCAFNHAILDGNSTWHFMTSWAELTRGEPISASPVHNRSLARSTRVPLSLPISPAAHELADPNPSPPSSLRARVFSFPESTILRLKSAINSSLPAGTKPFSTFKSLAAHAWRSISRARRLPPDSITIFAVFADCRSRLRPPLPDSYFGNVIQAVFTGTAIHPLLTAPPEFAAGLLQQAIEAHDAAAIQARLEEYESKPKMFYFTDAGINCVAVGSSPRFRVYDVDFGFGRPERVRSGKNNKFDGMMYLYPGRDGGKGIDVELTLDGQAMENLENDGEFLVAGGDEP
ncbi:BAHD acyltransferase DCR-like [Dendrobium catenatum]|uniref:BAHD acyltransferase DCR n=1 Tax=Dendrobium catenatum TaxID=906689 RepID=A0A2I0WQ55_9ASPA|nr:BAHD acyltransferase DCR-like [Dendrobium catenatum]PKU77766.1 BAHD acyltransferase DCR [Dendrobium catenatum]